MIAAITLGAQVFSFYSMFIGVTMEFLFVT